MTALADALEATRRRRKVASRKQWEKIAAEKHGPCRVCCEPGRNGGHPRHWKIELHHIVPRSAPWFGDDVAENIAPLCSFCHSDVSQRRQPATREFVAGLTDAEYAYVIDKLGEDALVRLYGIEYQRP